MQEKLSSSALASSSHTPQHQIKPLSKTSKGIAKICTLTPCYVVLNEDFNFKEKWRIMLHFILILNIFLQSPNAEG